MPFSAAKMLICSDAYWASSTSRCNTGLLEFRSRKFVRALHRHDMVGSMGKVGAAGDNAAAGT